MRKPGMNKSGSEMVEAAVVLPLLLLAVISLIYFGIFCHDVFREQLEVQQILLDSAEGDKSIFSIHSEDSLICGEAKGLFKGGFKKAYRQSLYVINEEMFIRGGSVIEAIVNE